MKDSHLKHEGHGVDAVTYAHYAENLRLNDEDTMEAQKMIRVDGNKKKIKMLLMRKLGKPVPIKALHNLQTKMSSEQQCDPDDTLASLHEILSKIPNATVKFVTNQHNELLGKRVIVKKQRTAKVLT